MAVGRDGCSHMLSITEVQGKTGKLEEVDFGGEGIMAREKGHCCGQGMNLNGGEQLFLSF